MDSSGIGVVMGRYKLMRSKGGHGFGSCQFKIEKLIEVSGLRKIIRNLKLLVKHFHIQGNNR